MRTLLIVRHAKSSWKNPELADHDRPLNARGKRDAPMMGRLLLSENLRPDLVLCSTAKRARRTAELLVEAGRCEAPIEYTEDLYHAGPDSMLEIIRRAPDELGTIMLIGHNPGLESLVTMLTDTYERLPTAAVCRLEADASTWSDLDDDSETHVANLWRPRDLMGD